MRDDEIGGVEARELATVVERLTGSPDPGAWRAEALHTPVASASVGIWRVSAETRHWSVVLKVIALREGNRRWQCEPDQDHWYYWRREAAAYGSGLLDSFVGGLRGPCCHLVADRPDGSVALWLDDSAVGGMPASGWRLERYGLAARHLGRAQGEFLVDRALPEEPWLSRRWLRSYLPLRDFPGDTALLADTDVWADPLIRARLDPALAAPLAAMLTDRAAMLDALDRLPRTLCHLDLHPANLFAVGDEATVAVDWSFVGIGAPGEDAGNLVPDAVLDFHVPGHQVDALFEVVVDGYARGLADAGWVGPEDLVRTAVGLGAVAKFSWIAPWMFRAVAAGAEHLNGRPLAEALDWWAPTVDWLARAADERRSLTVP